MSCWFSRSLFARTAHRALRMAAYAALVCALPAFDAAAVAGQWPQWLGPNRNGHAVDEKIVDRFDPDGPAQLWRARIGEGWASPVVDRGRLIVFHRLDDRDVVECLDSKTGRPIWKFDYPTDYVDSFGFDQGPRATPAIDGDRVYTFGAQGMLHCLSFQSGQLVWSVNTALRFESQQGFFGRVSSPLVDGDLVMINTGGRNGAGVAAFNKHDGRIVWSATNDAAEYSSPVTATIHGQRHALFITKTGLVSVDPADGRIRFQRPFRPDNRNSVVAATPIVIDDLIFISASYGTGAELLQVTSAAPRSLWSGDQILSNHYATSIHHDGFLYGFDGRYDYNDAALRCVELASGRIIWSQKPIAGGTLLLADEKLVILTEKGELILCPASPAGFAPTARAQVLGFDIRAMPAIAQGRLYARDKKQLVCLDLAVSDGR